MSSVVSTPHFFIFVDVCVGWDIGYEANPFFGFLTTELSGDGGLSDGKVE